MEKGDNENVKSGKPSIHTFSDKIMDKLMHFQVIKLDDSFHVWIGQTSGKFGEMSVAMNTKFSSVPTASAIIGGTDSPSVCMAQRLAKKTGKQVFVSCDFPYNQLIQPLIEKRIGEELKNHPSKF